MRFEDKEGSGMLDGADSDDSNKAVDRIPQEVKAPANDTDMPNNKPASSSSRKTPPLTRAAAAKQGKLPPFKSWDQSYLKSAKRKDPKGLSQSPAPHSSSGGEELLSPFSACATALSHLNPQWNNGHSQGS